jgi:phosphoesterase RecJ-like protein
MMDHPHQIAAILRNSHNILIACHVAPDGDCLGSALGLRLALARLGVDAQVGSADGVPAPFRTLPGAEHVLTIPTTARAEVGVAIECSALDRAGTFAPALAAATTLINIDHHLSNTGYGHVVYLDTAAAAVGEQITKVIEALRVPVDREIAQCLLTAVVTDTGSFRYPNTTAQTLRLAADLVDAGASVSEIVERVYETRSVGGLRLLGMALADVQLSADGRIAWTTVTPQMLTATGATSEETAGIVGMVRQIHGIQIALLFEQTPQGVRVSIRSRGSARANVIAESFAGGGHHGAAGFTGTGTLEQVIARTLAAAEKEIQQLAPPGRSSS